MKNFRLMIYLETLMMLESQWTDMIFDYNNVSI